MKESPSQRPKIFILGPLLCVLIFAAVGTYFHFSKPKASILNSMFFCDCQEKCINDNLETGRRLTVNNLPLDEICISECIDRSNAHFNEIKEMASRGTFVSPVIGGNSNNCKIGARTPLQKIKPLIENANKGDYSAQKQLCFGGWPDVSVKHCIQAANAGNRAAPYYLSKRYTSYGFTVDKKDVYFWLTIGLSYDVSDCGKQGEFWTRESKRILEKVQKTLSPSDTEEIEKRVASWKLTAKPADMSCETRVTPIK